MGRGSNDQIVNRYMPKTATLNVPNTLAIALLQPCRNEAELLACKSLVTSLQSLLEQTTRLQKVLRKAGRVLDAKIRTYEEEL